MAKTKEVSFSEIDTYRQCRLKWQLSYLEKWQTDETSPALSRGTLFHSVMEDHYGRIKDAYDKHGEHLYRRVETDPSLVEALKRQVKRTWLFDPDTGAQSEQQELVEWMYDGYVAHYGIDPEWRIQGVESRFSVWLPTENGTRSSFRLAGTVDLLVRDLSAGGGLWIVDHKTCRNLPRDIEVDLDDQAAIYTYLRRREGLNIRGQIRNAVRTERLKSRAMAPDERYLRRLTVRQEAELETVAREALTLMREAYKPVTEDRPRSPNPDTCRWKCPYTEPCLDGRKGRDMRKILEDLGFEQKETKPGPTFQKVAGFNEAGK